MRSTPRTVLVSLFLALAAFAHGHEAAVDMSSAATKFLSTLDPVQKKQASYTVTDAERENWNFVPVARQGLPFKQMTPAQGELARALIRTGLGQKGVLRAEAIMSMENVLKELEKANPRIQRDPVNYFITVFGTPGEKNTWGWRFEGHHLSFNFTIVDGAHVFFAPSFIGSNPAEVKDGPRKGERVLGEEEDLGHALVQSLTEAQRKVALFDVKAPNEIVTGNKKRVDPLSPAGIPAAQLTAPQRDKLFSLIKVYLARYRATLADEEFAAITAAGLDKVTFGWAGGLQRATTGSYYRIQGPTFLIEFDNTQNGANHIHSTFRDFTGDFGNDLLARHYAESHSQK